MTKAKTIALYNKMLVHMRKGEGKLGTNLLEAALQAAERGGTIRAAGLLCGMCSGKYEDIINIPVRKDDTQWMHNMKDQEDKTSFYCMAWQVHRDLYEKEMSDV